MHLGLSKVAHVLESTVRIFCFVLTWEQNHKKRAKHIKATWIRKCNKYLFMSSLKDGSIPTHKLNVSEGRENLWKKTREAFKCIHDNYLKDYDWFLKADDDTFVEVENLRFLLLPYSPRDALHFGYKYAKYVQKGYHSGGAGYVLSQEALRRFGTEGYYNEALCKERAGRVEDVQMGRCLSRIGATAGDSRDHDGLIRFSPISPDIVITGTHPKWLPNMSYYYTPKTTWRLSRMAYINLDATPSLGTPKLLLKKYELKKLIEKTSRHFSNKQSTLSHALFEDLALLSVRDKGRILTCIHIQYGDDDSIVAAAYKSANAQKGPDELQRQA